MNHRKNNLLGIVMVSIMIALLLGYDAIVIAEFHTANYGQVVNAKVIDISNLCRYKHKTVTLMIEGKTEEIRVYGRSCRTEDFPLNGQINVRVNKRLNIITLPHNAGVPRLIIFPFMTLIIVFALIRLIKHRRKLPQ